jgi:3D-(3,5/4)-trihydroxycyclohexane-1,2-dione acylhydrolase (decyclizing)
MAAISGLQRAQYEADFATNDSVEVVALASAIRGVRALDGGASVASLQSELESAYSYQGIALISVVTYWGENPRSSIPAYGTWNVGNWCEGVQQRYHEQDL